MAFRSTMHSQLGCDSAVWIKVVEYRYQIQIPFRNSKCKLGSTTPSLGVMLGPTSKSSQNRAVTNFTEPYLNFSATKHSMRMTSSENWHLRAGRNCGKTNSASLS